MTRRERNALRARAHQSRGVAPAEEALREPRKMTFARLRHLRRGVERDRQRIKATERAHVREYLLSRGFSAEEAERLSKEDLPI